MAAVVQHRPTDALAGRRFGSFAGKPETSGSAHPVGKIIQHRPDAALGGRRYGSFAGKASASGAATISAGTATITGSTTATVGCTTDTASGTLYALARTGATPADAATIIATGQSAAVSSTSPSIAYTGLTAATTYTWDMVQVVSAVNSNVLSDATGTTDNPGSGGGSIGILVPLGALTLTGNAPTVTVGAGQFIAVPLGQLTLTGYAPTIVGAVVQTEGGGWPAWPMPRRRTKKEIREERISLGILPADVVEELPAPVVKRARKVGTIKVEDLFGKSEVTAMSAVDLEIAVQRIKRKRRQRQEEDLLLM